ncbi:MAG: thioesterase family protein [Myxococcota bacterium]
MRYAECDVQNVVFNARYGDFVDSSFTEFMRATGLEYKAWLERGLDTQVVKLTMEYTAPARFDDIVIAEVECARVGRTSITVATRFLREGDAGEIQLVTAETIYVLVTSADYRPTPVPDDLRELLERGAPGVVVDQSGVYARGPA